MENLNASYLRIDGLTKILRWVLIMKAIDFVITSFGALTFTPEVRRGKCDPEIHKEQRL